MLDPGSRLAAFDGSRRSLLWLGTAGSGSGTAVLRCLMGSATEFLLGPRTIASTWI